MRVCAASGLGGAADKRCLVGVMNYTDVAPGIFTIGDFLSSAECTDLIRAAEALAFEAAPIITASGPKVESATRSNDRLLFDDHALAASLWERSCSLVPAVLGRRSAIGLNERFRLYRYTPGQKFSWHADAPFQRQNGEISLLTFMVYLNDTYEGGATRFESTKVVGSTGMNRPGY
jgi:hypothetical protein